MNSRSAALLAVAAGVALEVTLSVVSGHAEAWDSSAYWTLGYPAALLACAALGFVAPQRARLYGLLLVSAQCVTMTIRGGTVDSQTGAGLLVAVLLAVPCVVASTVGAALARGTRHEPA